MNHVKRCYIGSALESKVMFFLLLPAPYLHVEVEHLVRVGGEVEEHAERRRAREGPVVVPNGEEGGYVQTTRIESKSRKKKACKN